MLRAVLGAIVGGLLTAAACASDPLIGSTPADTDAGGVDAGFGDIDAGVSDAGSRVIGTGPYAIVYSGTGGVGIDHRSPVTIAASGDGQLDSWTFENEEARARATAKVGEIYADEFALLGRWHDGIVSGLAGGPQTYADRVGFHYGVVIPASSSPRFGTSVYSLVRATNVTIDDGSLATGTFTAKLSVLFSGTIKKAGLELSITMPGDGTYSGSTAGGVADPSTSLFTSSNGELTGGQLDVTGSGVACASGSTCKATVRVALSGGPANTRAVLAVAVSSGDASGKVLRSVAAFKTP